MEDADVKEAPLRGACEEEKQRNIDGRMRSSPSTNDLGVFLLQWGPGKQSRYSRADTYNTSSQVSNHSLKAGRSLANESALLRKPVHIQVDMASPALLNTSSLPSKGTSQATNGVAAKREHILSEDMRKQEAKVLKRMLSDAGQRTNGSSLVGGKRGYSSHHKQDQLLQQRKTCALPDRNLSPQDRCVAPLPAGRNGAGLSKNDHVPWPKLVIALSRKEKEEDFLTLKGTKLPQRSKRRAKGFEHYCIPGSWLVDISESRYDVVREKKRARKEPRGLKAMASLDSDSD